MAPRGAEGDGRVLSGAERRNVTPGRSAHDCIVEPGSLSEWVRVRLPDLKFSPATYEGTPFETEHGIHYVVYPRK